MTDECKVDANKISYNSRCCWSVHGRTCSAGALQVTISRISGICIGVGVSLLLSIIVYPSSASVKAMACLRQVRLSFLPSNCLSYHPLQGEHGQHGKAQTAAGNVPC